MSYEVCFCGGYGSYTDYNCGESFEVICPHCRGTGEKCCTCTGPTIRCGPHVPTGVEVVSRDMRSQHANRAEAMRMLREKLVSKEAP